MATTTAVLAAFSPAAVADDGDDTSLTASWKCVPAEDRDAKNVTVNGQTYYVRRYGLVTASVWELWQETNGDKGLQLTAGMSCVGAPDLLVESRCVGLCPIPL